MVQHNSLCDKAFNTGHSGDRVAHGPDSLTVQGLDGRRLHGGLREAGWAETAPVPRTNRKEGL